MWNRTDFLLTLAASFFSLGKSPLVMYSTYTCLQSSTSSIKAHSSSIGYSWQVKHFWCSFAASFFILGQKYPCLRILRYRLILAFPQFSAWIHSSLAFSSFPRHLANTSSDSRWYNTPLMITYFCNSKRGRVSSLVSN